jgi:glyoxylase-like metal-dependent hydrolase (beta-lactamase superfamily II)
MDHSSSLPKIAKLAKNATIIASERGKEALIEHYGAQFQNVQVVKSGDTLKLGTRTLTFLEAPMLHWPDSMFTYIVEDKILMPNDAFGQHLASGARFDDEVDQHILMEEAQKYYANILMLFGPLITRKIQDVVKMGIPIDMIAPSHGIIWRKDPTKIITAYMDWAAGKAKNKIVIVYDTMWGSTDKMARAIAEGAVSQGVDVKMCKLRASDNTEAMTEILDAKAVVVGSPALPFDVSTAHNMPLARFIMKIPYIGYLAMKNMRSDVLKAKNDVNAFLRSRSGKQMLHGCSADDLNFFGDPAWMGLMYQSMVEAFRQGNLGVKTVVQEHQMFMKPWSFSLSGVPGDRLFIWQGAEDKTCRVENAYLLSKSIALSQVKVFEGKGHCIMFGNTQELATLLNCGY